MISLSNLDFPDIFINCIKYDWNWYNMMFIPNLSCKFINIININNINKFSNEMCKLRVFGGRNINITPEFVKKYINKCRKYLL